MHFQICILHIHSNFSSIDMFLNNVLKWTSAKMNDLTTCGSISLAQRKTAVTPLLTHWSYCSLALSSQYDVQIFVNIKPGDGLIYSSTNRLSSLMLTYQITKFMGPTWGPPGSCRPQMGPMLALWTLLSGLSSIGPKKHVPCSLVVLLLLSIITDLLRLCFIISYIYIYIYRERELKSLRH